MKRVLFFTLLLSLCFACKDEKKEAITTQKNNAIEIPDAIKKMMDAAKKDSNNVLLQMQIVSSLDSLNLHKEALTKLDKLIIKDSLNNTFWLKRGQICKQLEDTPAAIKAFHYAAKIYPTPMSLMELANLYSETKNSLTLSISNQLMKMNPGGNYNAQAYYFMGVYYSRINDKKNAFNFLDKSISEDFHFEESYLEKGYILYNDKKYNEALKVLEQLTTINQTSSNGYYWQAKCNEALNNKIQAINLYQQSLQLDPTIKEATVAIERLKGK